MINSSDQNTSHNKRDSVFEQGMKRSLYISGAVVFVSLCVLAYFVFRYITRMASYRDDQSTYIPNPSSHQVAPLFSGENISSVSTLSIFDMLDGYIKLDNEKEEIQTHLRDYRTPFDLFLRFLYLPSLNVRKDPLVGTIDTTMMGGKFLENNPYTDISLINQWTDFFKYMGSNTYNEINSIVVNEIVEDRDFFYVPIQVSFTAPSRRAFLFLLDKLSLTSDKNNIMLVNEFFYYLWETIKSSDQLDPFLERLVLDDGLPFVLTDETRDNLIAYALMHRKEGDINMLPFLTQDVLQQTVRAASGCRDGASQEVCEFQFREKFRHIPRLAYGLGHDQVSDVDLLDFLSNIPPLIILDNFTFEKQYNVALGGDAVYEGSITMKVYGQGITSSEVDEVAAILGEQCFAIKQPMTISYAQSLVQKDLLEDVDPNVVSPQRSKDLLEIQGLLTDIGSQYDSLTNYQKIIKLFETYRMLDDALFCE